MPNPNCHCQLIVWGPGDIKFTPNVEPSLPQNQVPSIYREVEIPEGSKEAFNGQMMLIPAGEAVTAPSTPAIWKIEALDRHGAVVPRAFEFRLVDLGEITGLSASTQNWVTPYLSDLVPTPCDSYARFQFRLGPDAIPNNPEDPNDHYWIRIKWPGGEPDALASICTVRVKVTATAPSEPYQEPELPTEPSDEPPFVYGLPDESRHVYLHQVRPPLLPALPLPGVVADEDVLGTCRCQLIGWKPDEVAGDPDVDENTKQGDVQEQFRVISINLETGNMRGRYTLVDENTDTKKTAASGKLRIEAFNEDGAAVDTFEFRARSDDQAPQDDWASYIERNTTCAITLHFDWRVTDRVAGGKYTIVGTWPTDAGEHLKCQIVVTVVVPCSNELVLLADLADDNGRTFKGHVNALRANKEPPELLGCLERASKSNKEVRFSPRPETLGLQINFNGDPDRNMNWVLSQECPALNEKPLQFLALDSAAAPRSSVNRGKRKQGSLQGEEGKGEWRKEYSSVNEPCKSDPIRFLVRISPTTDVQKAIAGHLARQVQEGQRPTPIMVNIVITDSKFGPEDRPSPPVQVAIELGGGLRVEGHGNSSKYATNVMLALRRVAGNESPPYDFDWVDGTAPEKGAIKWIIPTSGFCNAENETRNVEGRKLLRAIMCGECCVTVIEYGGEHYCPWYIHNAFPAGAEPSGKVPESWEQPHGIPETIQKGAVRGTGVGTGGWVNLDDGTMASKGGAPISAWVRSGQGEAAEWVKSNNNQIFSPARFIAHEFAHALFACRGALRIGMPIDPNEVFGGTLAGARWTAKGSAFQDLGEYDAVVEWENKIALELGELPRFNKPG